jgi:hypothetical protein
MFIMEMALKACSTMIQPSFVYQFIDMTMVLFIRDLATRRDAVKATVWGST